MVEENPDESIMVEHWTDPARRERYQYYAREKYEFYKAAREISLKSNLEYGKWLLASGIAVHGGAIYAINALRPSVSPAAIPALMEAACWNVAGVVFILVSGFSGWMNFQYAAEIYDKWANPLMVYRTDQFPSDIKAKTDPVAATRFASMAFGILSLFALVVSAVTVFGAIKP